MRTAPVHISFFRFIILIVIFLPLRLEANTPFPLFNAIEPNVAFWIKVYTQYPTTRAIVHDSRDLSRVYDVIELRPFEEAFARKINRQRMKSAKAKYEGILKRLAGHPTAWDPESRRVVKLFGEEASSAAFRRASHHIRCQIGQSDRFMAGLVRSGAYIDQIRDIFRSYGLPEELAYLPHVESSFNVKAYSKFGAAGIWQFTRSTGKRFMNVSYVMDERRDPILATHAAASLLKENYEKLGSWPLAITAYNHGAAGMERARSSLGDYPAIFKSYRSRSFKFASRNFYSEFLAACRVVSEYQSYFGPLELDDPVQWRVVPMAGYVGFDRLCDHFNVSKTVAQALNPALRSPVIEGQKLVPKGYPFRLPTDLEVAAVPSGLYRDTQKPSHFYTVHRGDTAGRVARRNGVGLDDLIVANNLDHRARIYPGQTLRIPLHGDSTAAVPAPASKPAEPVLLARKEEAAPSPAMEMPSRPESFPEPVLASFIPASLTKKESDEAAVDSPSPSVEVVSADVGFERIVGPTSRPAGIIYVEVEETLGHYAEWAAVRTQQIRELNGLPFGSTLHLHQKIKIPLNNAAARKFEENRYEYHKRLQEDFFSVYRIGNLQPYRVKRGDNLWNLCLDKFDIPMWLLKNCNPEIDFADLRLNQKLMVPAIEKNSGEDSDPSPDQEQDSDDPTDGAPGDRPEQSQNT